MKYFFWFAFSQKPCQNLLPIRWYFNIFLNELCACVRACVRACVCVCVCVCVFDTMCQEQTLCMYSPCQERTHSMSVVGFGIRFGLVILKNPGIDHKIMGVAWVCPWHRKYFSNNFIREWKSALGKNLTHFSPYFTC